MATIFGADSQRLPHERNGSPLEDSVPTPGVRRKMGVEDRVIKFQGKTYRVVLDPVLAPDIGYVWYIGHFKPYRATYK
jgi:hypothetical protein